ncbi:hypothetical protein BH09ACT8_BH09ACT8_49500 [soil metagenome]
MKHTDEEPVPPQPVSARRANHVDAIVTVLLLCVHAAIALYVGLLDLILSVVLVGRGRIAFYVPILGCAANLVLALVVLHMASLAGPAT